MNKLVWMPTALLAAMLSGQAAHAERIKRPPLSANDMAREASEQAMNDGMLRKGDIVSTDRGLMEYRGLNPDQSPVFAPVGSRVAPTKSPTPPLAR